MPGSKGIDGVFIGIEPYEVNYCPNLSKNLQEQFILIVGDIEGIIDSIINLLCCRKIHSML
jgi:hypothetical protein